MYKTQQNNRKITYASVADVFIAKIKFSFYLNTLIAYLKMAKLLKNRYKLPNNVEHVKNIYINVALYIEKRKSNYLCHKVIFPE